MAASRGAVAAPQASAADAGAAALQAGGNAIDAALAAALSLTVSYPNNCALGGDLIALVRTADGRATAVNASGPAPQAASADAVMGRHGRMPVYGADTVTVPGLVGGLHALWEAGAALPWAAAFDVAIEQAAGGVDVSPTLAANLAEDAELLAADPGARDVFFDGDHVLRAGDRLAQPALAETLRTLAAEGPDALYRGDLGRSVIRCLQEHGSAMTEADLAAFAPELGEPLRRPHGDEELLTTRPNTQGFLLPLILGAVAADPSAGDPHGPGAGALARIALAAVRDRERHLADPRFHDVDVDALLDPDRLRRIAGGEGGQPTVASPKVRGDTVAVVSADAEGNAVCLIQSLFHAFGSGILDPGTGIVLHNRGALFDLDAASPNRLAPGKRPAHTLMPSMLLRDGRLSVVLGTMGGSGQPQILSHVLLHRAAGAGCAEALDRARWVVGGFGADDPVEVVLAEGRVPEAGLEALRATGLPVRVLSDYDEAVGHAQLITIGAAGTFDAASDPRSEGAARIV